MPDPALRALATVTPRDRQLLRWLHDHHVLTTGQIAAALFDSPITAAHRLALLHRRELIDRFRWHPGAGGSQPYHHVLGPLGARIIAAERGVAPPRPHQLRQRRQRLAAHPQLAHKLGVNDFFTQLAAHARRAPDAELVAWLNTTQAIHAHALFNDSGIRPDAYGEWREHHRTSAFFLEHDTGTEALHRVHDKITAYQHAVRGGWPRHTILIWLPNATREANLHHLLTRQPPPPMPVATASREHSRPTQPAEAIWAQPHHLGPRRPLAAVATHL